MEKIPVESNFYNDDFNLARAIEKLNPHGEKFVKIVIQFLISSLINENYFEEHFDLYFHDNFNFIEDLLIENGEDKDEVKFLKNKFKFYALGILDMFIYMAKYVKPTEAASKITKEMAE